MSPAGPAGDVQVARGRTLVDRGGTFTDVVTESAEGMLEARKVRSDIAVVGRLAAGALCFGTTVVTNALLEGQSARVCLLVTEGLGDLPEIGDMTRPELFDADARRPSWPGLRVVEVRGRIDNQGREIEPLDLPELFLDDVDAVAVVLHNSPLNPAHERALGAALPAGLRAVLSHERVPELGLVGRMETTLLDAALGPVLEAALVHDQIPRDAQAIRSDASLCVADELRAPDAVLSGPAGGVLAVRHVAERVGARLAVGLDMGGPSTDVCLVEPGPLRYRAGESVVAGRRVRRPALDVETIAAGGGSILGHDGVRYTVGPASAGAHPGPQAFGKGGPPTLTDAAIKLGLLLTDTLEPPLDVSRISLPGPAGAFVEIARESMAAAVRRLALARGADLDGAVLVAYGGAAGQHACAVAEKLGLRRVAVHALASVMSAFGQRFARAEEERSRPVWRELRTAWPLVMASWDELSAQLHHFHEQQRWLELRYAGTDSALRVAGSTETEAAQAFETEHQLRFGFSRPELPIEVVQIGVRGRESTTASDYCVDWPASVPEEVEGPCLLALPGTSLLVPAGWRGRREGPVLVLDHLGPGVRREGDDEALSLALWSSRFSGIAAEAGEVLRGLARSVNIRERLDFSCAIFDAAGTLVANAPHVPVHLGAMGATVRDLLAAGIELPHGGAWLTNDPAAGGSHLPDLTVVSRAGPWFVASRAHHVDVGGLTPGSMPPRSRTLADEGLVFRRLPLVDAGHFRLPKLIGCRDPLTVEADLRAQVACNAHMARRLAEHDAALLSRWMGGLLAAVTRAAREVAPGLDGEAADEIDGIPLRVRVSGARFDFSGTGGPHAGNLNAPACVVRAAVIYVLRCMLGRDLPLNEGLLRAVEIVVPPGSILDPPPGAAVVGGNVETSQRLVDLLLRATGQRAASQGTMNNLSLGGEGWAYYETLGGGLGASPRGPGASGGQVHMTNTRATDPEVLEARLPLRLRAFRLRRGGGGEGLHRGGDGLEREIELLAPAAASLLAAWRPGGAPGLDGGAPGLPGEAWTRRDGTWTRWTGETLSLRAGDRVRVLTPGGGGWGPR